MHSFPLTIARVLINLFPVSKVFVSEAKAERQKRSKEESKTAIFFQLSFQLPLKGEVMQEGDTKNFSKVVINLFKETLQGEGKGRGEGGWGLGGRMTISVLYLQLSTPVFEPAKFISRPIHIKPPTALYTTNHVFVTFALKSCIYPITVTTISKDDIFSNQRRHGGTTLPL